MSCISPSSDCGCLNQVTSDCVFYKGNYLSCVDVTQGDDLTNILKNIDSLICSIPTPTGVAYVGTPNQINVTGNVIGLSNTVTTQISNLQSNVTALQSCVNNTVKSITSSTLSVSTTNTNSCGRTLNIEAITNPTPLSEKSGIIENIIDSEFLPNNTIKSKNLVPYGLKVGDSLIIKGGIRKANTDDSDQSITISDGTNTQVVSAMNTKFFVDKNKFIDFEIKLPVKSVSGSTSFTTRVFSIMDVLISNAGGSIEQFEDNAYLGKRLTQIQATSTFNQSSFCIIFNNSNTGLLEYLTIEIKRKI